MKYKIDPIPNIINKAKQIIFPFPLRCLIVGKSGCGKTTLLYNLIIKEFHYLYIFSKSLQQNIYQNLKKAYEKLSVKEDTEIAYFFNNSEELISIAEREPNSLVVFGDCINVQQQQIIKYYFVRGRHKNISYLYLTQYYAKVDRQLIRNNINFFFAYLNKVLTKREIFVMNM